MSKTPAILFHDHIAAYGVIRALGPRGIPIYVVSENGQGISLRSRYVKKHLVLPSDHPNFPELLNEWVLKHVGHEAVLIPAGSDDYLDVLSQNAEALVPGLLPTYPDWETVKLVREKSRTFQLAEEAGIPIPKTYHIRSNEELDNLLSKGLDFDRPVVMKPGSSKRFVRAFGSQVYICREDEEIRSLYQKLEGFWGDLILQELIPGDENRLVNVIAALDRRGDALGGFVNRKRRSVRRFSTCSLMETSWSREALEYSTQFLKHIRYRGYANPEYKVDPRDGLPKLMEINGRVTMSNSHALKCGINLPYMMYRDALGEDMPCMNAFVRNYKSNILWCDIANDLPSMIRQWRAGEAGLTSLIRSYKMRGIIIEPISIRDPLPGIIVVGRLFVSIIKGLWKSIFRRRSRNCEKR